MKTNTITVTSDLGKSITIKAKLLMGLVVIGDYDNVKRLKEIIYKGVECAYNIDIIKIEDRKYNICIGPLKLLKVVSKNGVSFYNEISKILYSDFTTTITVESGNKNVDVGSYNLGIIDIADIEQFPQSIAFKENKVGTQQGKLIHELAEQYYKQKNKFPDWIRTEKETKVYYDKSHGHGLKVEEKVDGLKRIQTDDPEKTYIYGEYSKHIEENAIGRKTIYYNPVTKTTYIERVELKHNVDDETKRRVIKMLAPQKVIYKK